MEFKRGISIGIIFYLVTFTIGGILSIGLKLDNENPSPTFLIATIISMILFTAIFTYWYFAKEGIKRGYSEGFKIGLVFLLVSTILDLSLLSISILLMDVESSTVTNYYYSPLFILSIISLVITATIVGGVIKKNSK